MTARPRRVWRAHQLVADSRIGTSASLTVVVDALLHDGGVIVFRGHAVDGQSVRCVARRKVMRTPAAGETWAVEGTWQLHGQYGPQLGEITTASLLRPSGTLFVQAVARNTRNFPEIGAVRAQKLWEAHGPLVFDLLDAGDAGPFLPQLGPELAAVLVAGWRALDDEAKAYRWLTQYGFPVSLAGRVIAIYSALPVPPQHAAAAATVGPVVWHLEDDPYRMLAFAGWKKVDAAARRVGVSERDPRRLVGAIEAVCARQLSDGHTWLAREVLRTKAARLLDFPVEVAEEGIRLAVERRAVVEHAGGYQAPGAWVMERFVEARVERMRAGQDAPAQMRLETRLTRLDVERLLDEYDATQPYSLSAEQRDAVWMSLTEPVSLLIGGAGVGKTTVLRAVHHVAEAQGRTVLQAALAGRAAQRMREATGRHALTIAGLIARIEKAQIVLDDEPLIILDEASMCDLTIMYRLLRHCPPGVRLLLVGDPGQLPPIGPGLVFHVLAASDPSAVPRTLLTVPRRQTDASGIPRVCESIRAGAVPTLTMPDWEDPHGVSFVVASPATVTDTIIDVLAQLGHGRDVQIVGSVKDRQGGIVEINRRLQSLFALGRGAQLNGRFFAGDPVLVTKNDWDLGVMNGDLGTALANEEGGALRVRFDEGEKVLPAESLAGDVELAYAITCHKAQGSQFHTVIVPVTPSQLLDRTLLLTAVSRAQQQVVIIGEPAIFAEAVARQPASLARTVGLGR